MLSACEGEIDGQTAIEGYTGPEVDKSQPKGSQIEQRAKTILAVNDGDERRVGFLAEQPALMCGVAPEDVI